MLCIPRANCISYYRECGKWGRISAEYMVYGNAGVAQHLFQRSDYRAETVAVYRCEDRQGTAVAFHIQYAVEHHRFAVDMCLPLPGTVDYRRGRTETVHHCVLVDESGKDIHSHHGGVYR